jgi:hypothetical protein
MILALLVSLSQSNFTVVSPARLSSQFPSGLSYSVANFGHIPYGKQVIANLSMARSFGDAELCNVSAHVAKKQKGWVMAERGDCTFVSKAVNAENMGF